MVRYATYDYQTTAPFACATFVTRSQVLPLNIRDRSSVVLLAPHMVVPDSPNDSHDKDKSGPVEVRGIGIGCDGEEHEDEEHGFESEGTGEKSRSQRM